MADDDVVRVLEEVLADQRARLAGASDRDSAALTVQIRGLVAELESVRRRVPAPDDELAGRRGLTRRPKAPGSRKRTAGGK